MTAVFAGFTLQVGGCAGTPLISAEYYNDQGNRKVMSGNLDAAVAAYRLSLTLNPDLAETHYNLGFVLKVKGDLDGAIAEYRTALRLDPNFAAAHNRLGLALQAKGDLAGALAEYRTALALNPNDANAHYNLGLALKAQGDLDGALAEYRTAVRLNPDLGDAHYYPGREVATLAYRNGDYATALRITQPLAEQGNPSAQYDLGVLYEKGRGVAKDEVEAATWYRKAADQGYEQAQRALRRLGVR